MKAQEKIIVIDKRRSKFLKEYRQSSLLIDDMAYNLKKKKEIEKKTQLICFPCLVFFLLHQFINLACGGKLARGRFSMKNCIVL